MNTGYKSLLLHDGKLVSAYDHSEWTLGEWRQVAAPAKACVGLCCSPHATQAYVYVTGDVIALVEYGGHVIDSGDKLTCERMRLLRVWPREEYKRTRLAAWEGYDRTELAAREEYERAVDAALLDSDECECWEES